MKRLSILCSLLFWLATPSVWATTYYVSATGNDSYEGTSPAKAWATIAKVNATTFQAGDTLLFEGGSIFEGSIFFGQQVKGTADQPLVISSYYSGTGRKRATIRSGDKAGLKVYNAAGYHISRLKFEGSGRSTNAASGIEFYMDLPDTHLPYVHIDSVEVWGYRNSGIVLGSWKGASGYENVRITNSLVHDSGDAGISSYAEAVLGHRNFYIGHTKVYNISGLPEKTYVHSGNGIVLGGVDGALIEYCEAYNNGWLNAFNGGGPVGIWGYSCNNLVIQYSESHHNKTGTGKDGGGFDIDGGCTNCILQYNYSHDNDGAGYLIAQYVTAPPLINPIIRYNISENDARNNAYGAIHLWSSGSNGGIQNAQIYNNTVYLTPAAGGSPKALCIQSGGMKNISIRNNLFQTSGDVALVRAASTSGVRFEGNNYWSDSGDFQIRWGSSTFTSLSSWQGATGQEMWQGSAVGFSLDPLLKDPGKGVSFAQPGQLHLLQGYELAHDSPLTDKGLHLAADWGWAIGQQDFWGNSLEGRSSFSIGAHQPTDNSKACLQGGIVFLEHHFPEGGRFQGKGVVESHYFNPLAVGEGLHSLVYTYIDGEGKAHALPYSVRVVDATTTSWLPQLQGSSDWFSSENWSSCVPTPQIDASIDVSPDPAARTTSGGPQIEQGRAAKARNLHAKQVLQLQAGTLLEINGDFEGAGIQAELATVILKKDSDRVPAGVYGTLQLEGAGNKRLAGPVEVKRELRLGEGKLYLSEQNMRIAETASIKNVSDRNYLVMEGAGSLILEGIAAGKPGLFPVGTATAYTPARIENGGEKDDFSLRLEEAVWSEGTKGAPLLQEGVNLTWHLEEAEAGGSEVQLQLQWTTALEQELFVRSNSYISHYEEGAWSLPDAQAGQALEGEEHHYLQLEGLTSFSPFTIRNRPIPLPVTWLEFRVSQQREEALLEWKTYNEIDNQGFWVEVSEDGEFYTTVGFVPGRQSTAGTPMRYSFRHKEHDPQGKRYYRLRQVDVGGSSSYSAVRMLEFSNLLSAPVVYPNPFSDRFRVTLSSAAGGEARLQLIDAFGQPVYRTGMEIEAGENEIILAPGQQLRQGMYILKIWVGDELHQLKLIKH